MLTPDKTRIENGVTIKEKIIPKTARANKDVASWCKKGQPMKPNAKLSYGMTGVTIHNTEDLPNVNDDAEQYTRATWPNCNMGGVVVHYYVDDLGAWQNLEETEAGWHAADGVGQGNYGTIALEVIMNRYSTKENEAAEKNAIKLAASILHRYKLGINALYTHNHWMGQPDKIVSGVRKNCPIYILPHWDKFKSEVKAELDRLNKSTGTTTPSTPAPKTISVGSKVKIKPGSVYGGSASTRGKTVPVWIVGKTYTVSKIQKNNGVDEALLKEIASWVALSSLES